MLNSILLLAVMLVSRSAFGADLDRLVERVSDIAIPNYQCPQELTKTQTMFEGFPFDLARHKCLFNSTYIISGASISEGNRSVSPVAVLSEASASDVAPLKTAHAGDNSMVQLPAILNSGAGAVRTVFAYDLFFWDAADPQDCGASVKNAKRLLQWASENKVNLVVGNVPIGKMTLKHFLIGSITYNTSGCGPSINEALESCREQEFCFLVDNKARWDKVQQAGGVKVEDRFFPDSELRPDGLHFSRNGAIVAAEDIALALDAKKRNCP